MNDSIFFTLTLVSALGSGLMAGTFFAFSTFVMGALARLPPAQGIAAMQSINVVVLNPVFLGVFTGTAATCVLLVIAALLTWVKPGAGWALAGGLLYVVGTFIETLTFHVPRNNALAAVDPASAESARRWADYITSWTAGNHVRTAAALVAAAALTVGLWLRGSAGAP
ncbi:anthrone oxygenase family protein [Sorangium cellulosum]|uniref:DUF1772 domain-containing protein n=1 Tax=Sorangium cellulosum TaxID=56 RepID=A0A150QQ02_SORCE|nr:anthrone oxygenase family protein [Sorangium cellulosum]KYF70071.1 hypothetical protein BE15_19055 [Sorangium cellulosum]